MRVLIRLKKLFSCYQIKCTQYWPELNKAARHGKNSVRNIEENEYAFYVIRKLKIANKEVNISNSEDIFHDMFIFKSEFLLSFYRETLILFPVLRKRNGVY